MRYLKVAVFLTCLLPFLLMVQGVLSEDLGANPVENLTHGTGDWALRLLLVTLAVTPLRKITGWSRILSFRRMLGLYAFFYASLHFLIWIWLDRELMVVRMLEDIFKRPYITVGFTAFILLIPLAATSNLYAMKKLGRRWKQLHKAVYPIGLLAVLHYLWLVKADLREPLIYGMIYIALLTFRVQIKRNTLGE